MVAQFFRSALPFPSLEVAAEFVTAQSYLVIGAYPMMNLTAKQKEAMEAIGEETNPEYYKQGLVHSIEILLQGLTVRSS